MFFWSLKFQFCQFCPHILQMLSMWTFYPLMLKKYNRKYTHKKIKLLYLFYNYLFSIKNKFIKNSTPVPNPQHLALQQYHHPDKCKSPMGATHENPLPSWPLSTLKWPSAKNQAEPSQQNPKQIPLATWWPSNSP